MAFIPAANCVEIDVNQRLHGQQVQNTLYAISFGGWTPELIETLAGEVITWVGTELYSQLSADISLDNVLVRDISVADGPQFTGVPTVPVTGALVGDALPGNCALVVSFRTGFAGRSRRGRNYVAGLRKSDQTDNGIATGIVTGLTDAYAALNTALGAASGAHVVLSRYSNNAPRAAALPTLVTSYLADNVIDSQRRRLTGRGD